MDSNSLILGDCIEVMKELPKQSFDIILTDPPYMTTDLHFDKDGFDITDFANTCLPLLKTNGYLISFGSVELLASLAKFYPIRWTGGWLKPNGTMRTAIAKKPMSKVELYAVMAHPKHKVSELTFNPIKVEGKPYKKIMRNSGYKRGGKDSISRANSSAWTKEGYVIENKGTRIQSDIIEAPNKPSMVHKERTNHPTQKPIKLLNTLIQWCSNKGDRILDPFMGSGSTAIACIESGRDYVCIEKNNEYYSEAVKRVLKFEEERSKKVG